MKELNVLEDRCIGCGACAMIDEAHFDIDSETGISKVISQENLENEAVQEAMNACPVAAIEMLEKSAVSANEPELQAA